MSMEHRVKIQNSNILNALVEHIEGTREMSATQVSAGLGLLKKTLPDLSAVQVSGDEEGSPITLKVIERVITDSANPDSKDIPPATGTGEV